MAETEKVSAYGLKVLELRNPEDLPSQLDRATVTSGLSLTFFLVLRFFELLSLYLAYLMISDKPNVYIIKRFLFLEGDGPYRDYFSHQGVEHR